jgi:hypothetical protein
MTLRAFDNLPSSERDYWVADWNLSQQQCPHGGPRDECSDPEGSWYAQRLVCRAAMETAAAQELYADLHEKEPYHDGTFKSWAEKRSFDHPYHFNDGVTFYAAPVDVNPDDQFLTR